MIKKKEKKKKKQKAGEPRKKWPVKLQGLHPPGKKMLSPGFIIECERPSSLPR